MVEILVHLFYDVAGVWQLSGCMKNQLVICTNNSKHFLFIRCTDYSLSPGVWQSFVTIRSCNHLMRIISSMSTTQRKVRSREDDNYSNWVIINYGVYKGLYPISCLLQIIKPFIRPPQGLLFLVVKTF